MGDKMYFARIEKITREMVGKGIDLFLISPSSDLFYLTGYAAKGDERLLLLVLPQDGVPFILANLLYREQVKTLPVKECFFWKDGEDPFAILKSEIEKRKIKRGKAALEAGMPALFAVPISQTFPAVQFQLGSSLIDPSRQFKDEDELNSIRRASRAADEALAVLIRQGR